MGDPIAIAVVDDQDVVHTGIEALLTGAEPPVKIMGNFTLAAAFLAHYPAATPALDAVVCEPHPTGHRLEFDSLDRMCRSGHRVIVYSRHLTDEIILRSLELGAWTYVCKSDGGGHLREAVFAAWTGNRYIAPRMAEALMREKIVGRPRLSKRESEVLIAWFHTENKELVGKRLFIEPSTVCTHLQRVRAKYAAVGRPAPTKTALLARAIQDGILSVDDL